MKKLLVLAGILLFWYLAGLYRSIPLLVLALAWAGCGILLFLCARLAARSCSAAPVQTWYTARRGQETAYEFSVQNKGRLPVCRIRLQLTARNLPGQRASRFRLLGGVGAKDCQNLSATLVAPACGVTELRLTRLWASDPIGLFAAGKKLDERALLAVLPAVPPLRLSLATGGWGGNQNDGQAVSQSAYQGAPQPEQSRALRDYRPGDPLRLVHWPQTAHSSRLILREPERETPQVITIFLPVRGEELAGFRLRTAYLELAWALLAGAGTLPFRLRLLAPAAGVDTELSIPASPDAVDEAMLALYRGWFTPPAAPRSAAFFNSAPPNALCLDAGLRLTWQGAPLAQFDQADYARQIDEQPLTISL